MRWPILAKFFHTLLDNRRAAAQLVARIEQATAEIAEQPHLGVVTRNSKFRRFPVGNYLIVYEVGPNEVVTHYVRHGARLRPWGRRLKLLR